MLWLASGAAGAMSPVCSWGEICTLRRLSAACQFTQLDSRHDPAHSVLNITMVLGASSSGGNRACLFILGNADCQKIVPTPCTGNIKPFLYSAPSVKKQPWQKREGLPRSLLSNAIVAFPTLDDLFQQHFHEIVEWSLQVMWNGFHDVCPALENHIQIPIVDRPQSCRTSAGTALISSTSIDSSN